MPEKPRRKGKRRLKFIWGSGDALPGEWKLGLWGKYDRGEGTHGLGTAVSVRGLLRWFGVVCVAAYLVGATALYVWLRGRPYNLVTYTDTLLLPVRWPHVREQLGRSLIAQGLDEMKAQKWFEGQMHLRAGLNRAPHDLRARMELAGFYSAINQRPRALKVLTEDLDSGYPGRRYLESLFAIAAAGEDYDVIVAACDRYLPTERDDHLWLLTQKIQALLDDHRPAEALALVEKDPAAETSLLREKRVFALLDLGRGAEAVDYLAHWKTEPGASAAQITRLQVRALRETGRFADMDAALAAFRDLAPSDPRTSIYSVVQLALAGRTREASAAMDDFLFRFSSSAQSLLALATALAETPARDLLQRCRDEAALHGFPLPPFDMALLQAQVRAADWNGALQTLPRIKPVEGRASQLDKFVYSLFDAMVKAAAMPDDAAQATLVALIQERPLTLKIYRQTAEALLAAGRLDTAGRVLGAASVGYPTSPTLARLREQLDAAKQKQAEALAAAQSAQAPAASTPALGKDFFAQLDQLMQDAKWNDAAEEIRRIRVARPAWLRRSEDAVLERQMTISVHRGDALELLAAVTLYLDGTREHADRVLQVAREARAAGMVADGERVVNEVLRKQRDYPPATRLLREWHPPEPEPKAAGAKAAPTSG